MYKQTPKNFIVIYITFVVVLIAFALEISIRLLRLTPPIETQYSNFVKDAFLPYKPRPFSVISGRSMSGEFDFEYRHNSLGLRDSEHTQIKPHGVFRILGLGDSFTYGSGAAFEDTYLYILEKMLNSRHGVHPSVEIIKAGIPRSFPELERIFLQHYGVKSQPDLILVGFLPNDIIDTHMGIDVIRIGKEGYLKTYEAEQLGEIGTWLYMNSHLARAVLSKYISYRVNKKYFLHLLDIYKSNGYHEKDWQKVESEYKKMIELANEAGAKIVFIHIPQRETWNDTASYPSDRLSMFCQDNGAYFIDVLPSMKTASRNTVLYWEKDGHCNSNGYRIIAEVIYAQLTEKGLVP